MSEEDRNRRTAAAGRGETGSTHGRPFAPAGRALYSPDHGDDAPAREKSIALVGLMGAGKSTVGRRLAKRLGLPFADADEEIEAAAGLSIAEIFERFGEAHFRDGERRVLAPADRGAAAGDRDRRRRVHGSRDAGADPRALHRDLARRRGRDPGRAGRPPRPPAPAQGQGPAAPCLRDSPRSATRSTPRRISRIRSGALPHDQTVDRIVAALAAR